MEFERRESNGLASQVADLASAPGGMGVGACCARPDPALEAALTSNTSIRLYVEQAEACPTCVDRALECRLSPGMNR